MSVETGQLDPEEYFPSVISKKKKRKIESSSADNDCTKEKRRRHSSPASEVINNHSISFDENTIPILHRQPLRKLSNDEIETLQKSGVSIKQGAFSAEENARIIKNYQKFVQEIGGDYQQLFGVGNVRNKERKKLVHGNHFCARLAHGLPDRHVWYVYLCARRICHPDHESRHSRKHYTAEEETKLLQLRRLHSDDYVTIGAAMNRTPHNVADHIRLITTRREQYEKKNKGPFDQVAFLKLLICVSDSHALNDFSACRRLLWSQINWKEVEERMEDRTANACMEAWKHLFLPACMSPNRAQLYFLCCLVRAFARGGAEVPWDELARDVGLADGWVAKDYFLRRKRDILADYFPDIDVADVPLRKAARKMLRYLKTKEISCFRKSEFWDDDGVGDIPTLDSRHNLSVEFMEETA